ncbi:hypothetical protein BHE74_00050668, partial [Ensete ventricosum]
SSSSLSAPPPLPLHRRQASPLYRLATGGRCPYGLAACSRPLRPGRRQPLPLQPRRWRPPPVQVALNTAGRPLAGDQAVADRPCWRPSRGWPPILILTMFAAKMQQERIERFYAIGSHHMQFKINLSHKNIGYDTTVGNALEGASHMQRKSKQKLIWMEKMKEVKRPPL